MTGFLMRGESKDGLKSDFLRFRVVGIKCGGHAHNDFLCFPACRMVGELGDRDKVNRGGFIGNQGWRPERIRGDLGLRSLDSLQLGFEVGACRPWGKLGERIWLAWR